MTQLAQKPPALDIPDLPEEDMADIYNQAKAKLFEKEKLRQAEDEELKPIYEEAKARLLFKEKYKQDSERTFGEKAGAFGEGLAEGVGGLIGTAAKGAVKGIYETTPLSGIVREGRKLVNSEPIPQNTEDALVSVGKGVQNIGPIKAATSGAEGLARGTVDLAQVAGDIGKYGKDVVMNRVNTLRQSTNDPEFIKAAQEGKLGEAWKRSEAINLHDEAMRAYDRQQDKGILGTREARAKQENILPDIGQDRDIAEASSLVLDPTAIASAGLGAIPKEALKEAALKGLGKVARPVLKAGESSGEFTKIKSMQALSALRKPEQAVQAIEDIGKGGSTYLGSTGTILKEAPVAALGAASEKVGLTAAGRGAARAGGLVGGLGEEIARAGREALEEGSKGLSRSSVAERLAASETASQSTKELAQDIAERPWLRKTISTAGDLAKGAFTGGATGAALAALSGQSAEGIGQGFGAGAAMGAPGYALGKHSEGRKEYDYQQAYKADLGRLENDYAQKNGRTISQDLDFREGDARNKPLPPESNLRHEQIKKALLDAKQLDPNIGIRIAKNDQEFGGPGAAKFAINPDGSREIIIRRSSSPETVMEEVAHSIAMSNPEARIEAQRYVHQLYDPQEVQNFKVDYAKKLAMWDFESKMKDAPEGLRAKIEAEANALKKGKAVPEPGPVSEAMRRLNESSGMDWGEQELFADDFKKLMTGKNIYGISKNKNYNVRTRGLSYSKSFLEYLGFKFDPKGTGEPLPDSKQPATTKSAQSQKLLQNYLRNLDEYRRKARQEGYTPSEVAIHVPFSENLLNHPALEGSFEKNPETGRVENDVFFFDNSGKLNLKTFEEYKQLENQKAQAAAQIFKDSDYIVKAFQQQLVKEPMKAGSALYSLDTLGDIPGFREAEDRVRAQSPQEVEKNPYIQGHVLGEDVSRPEARIITAEEASARPRQLILPEEQRGKELYIPGEVQPRPDVQLEKPAFERTDKSRLEGFGSDVAKTGEKVINPDDILQKRDGLKDRLTGSYITDEQLKALPLNSWHKNLIKKMRGNIQEGRAYNVNYFGIGRNDIVLDSAAKNKNSWAKSVEKLKGNIESTERVIAPIGFQLTNKGNLLVTAVDMDAVYAKADKWQAAGHLNSLFGGDKTRFIEDINTYTKNIASGLEGQSSIGDPRKQQIRKFLGISEKKDEAVKNTLSQFDIKIGRDHDSSLIKTFRADRIGQSKIAKSSWNFPLKYMALKQNLSVDAPTSKE